MAQAGNAVGQVVINSAADIPFETASGAAQAYYEAATGNVYFALGTDLLIAGIAGVDDQLIFENFDQTKPLNGVCNNITEIAFLTLPPPFGQPLASGIFNLGAVLPADPSITDIASFQASPFGDATLQFSVFEGPEGFNPFNVIAPTAAVPEPGPLALFALAGLSALARRRR